VSDLDASVVHRDDPAVVLLEGETDAKHHGRPARVEWVRLVRPTSYTWCYALWVWFRGRGSPRAPGPMGYSRGSAGSPRRPRYRLRAPQFLGATADEAAPQLHLHVRSRSAILP
jgi:hypothetical protein